MQNHKFRVALVGRPNVGKSSLFNVLTKRRAALVKDESGVTRDFRFGQAEWWGHPFEVVDTGGWTEAQDLISGGIREKLENKLSEFDLLVFVCDSREGLSSDDKNFFALIRGLNVNYLVALNKCDSDAVDEYEFYSLGHTDFIKISCEHKIGIDQLVEAIIDKKKEAETKNFSNSVEFEEAESMSLGEASEEERDEEELEEALREPLKITVVGKPNVGKSSLVNQIIGKEEQLVSSIAGTTTDSISFDSHRGELDFRIFDTAGVRRKAKLDGSLEGLTMIKSLETIEKAEFVLLVLDGMEGPSRAEARLIEKSIEMAKPFLIVVNKWDQRREKEGLNKETYKADLVKEFHFLRTFEFVFVSALTGSGVDKLFLKIQEMREKLAKKIGTGALNRFFERVIKQAPSPFYNNKQVKLYYITQTKQRTPSFLCFANYPKGVTPAYRRFLENRIREEFDFNGVPVRVFFLPKDSSKRGRRFNG